MRVRPPADPTVVSPDTPREVILAYHWPVRPPCPHCPSHDLAHAGRKGMVAYRRCRACGRTSKHWPIGVQVRLPNGREQVRSLH